MMLQFKNFLLALIFQRVHSNNKDFEIEIDSTTSYESCNDPDETASESNCYCYNEPEKDFEYSICFATNGTTTTPSNCPLDAKIVKFLNQCFVRLRYWKSVCTAVTVGFVNSRHFSNIEVVQNTDLRI